MPEVLPPLTAVDLCLWVCALCVAVQNPCADQNGGCMHECRVDGGKAHCDCKAGFILAEDRKTCEGNVSRKSADIPLTELRVNLVLSGKQYKQVHLLLELLIISHSHLPQQMESAQLSCSNCFEHFKDFLLAQKLCLRIGNDRDMEI